MNGMFGGMNMGGAQPAPAGVPQQTQPQSQNAFGFMA